jgi:hypothetical protein
MLNITIDVRIGWDENKTASQLQNKNSTNKNKQKLIIVQNPSQLLTPLRLLQQ